jgi:diguanylate cyclase (GGDEF)-like protein
MKFSWMMRWLAVAAFSPITLFLLWMGYMGMRGIDASTQEAIAHQRLAKQHWSELAQQIALTRHDALPSYDEVSQSAHEFKDDIVRLQTDAMGLDSLALHIAVDRVAELQTGQMPILETFKSTNALLRNSLRYLPTEGTDLANALRASGRGDLAHVVEDLRRDVLVFNLTANPELRDSLQVAAAALAHTLSFTRWHEEGSLLVKHIGMTLDNKVRLDSLMSALLGSPMPAALDAVAQQFQQIQRDEAVRQNQYLTAISVYAAILLGLAGYFGFRLKRRTEDFRQQATHDSLTGLSNRAQLHTDMQRLIHRGMGFTLMLIDLDRFKEINDTLGHQSGDQLLKKIAPRLERHLLKDACVARLGGDEFAVLLTEYGDASATLARAAAMRESLSQPYNLNDVMVEVGASVGIVCYPEHGLDSSELLRHADIAMYAAKRGEGCLLYTPGLNTHSPRRLALMGELGNAIREGQLELHYQPKVDLRNGSVASVEALLRWNHPQLGQIPPGEFIPMVEMSYLIHALTQWVIEAAARQIRTWDEAGLMLNVAVNLSARNLMDETLPLHIQRILDAQGVSPERMEMEVTEGAIMVDTQRAIRVLDRIDQMGIKLAIDDFGTGYSSLAYLVRLPVDEIKLDRAFVSKLSQESGEAAIVLATVQMAHNLGLTVIAEGAEDAATVSKLIQANYDAIQGYYFSKPLPAAALQEWVFSGRAKALLDAARVPVVLTSVDYAAAETNRAVVNHY